MLLHRVSVVDSRQSTGPLADEHIAQVFTDAFSPYRCTVEFQDDQRRIALRVRGTNGTEFIVEGKRLDLLRDANALAQYIQDVKRHLRQHRLVFQDRTADNVLSQRDRNVEPYLKQRRQRRRSGHSYAIELGKPRK
jgi:hypothetical protein